jgi:hypothetical protein
MIAFLIFSLYLLNHIECTNMPRVERINKNEPFSVNCDFQTGFQFCMSTYILRNSETQRMTKLDPSKFKYENRKVNIAQVNGDYTGFYACSIDCSKINYTQIFFLQILGNYKYFYYYYLLIQRK